jgi:hypothetical protein
LVDFGVWASQAFYRIATVAETFTTVATLASNATERRITVAVLRSTTGGFTFVSGTNLSSFVESPTFPGTISGPAFSAANNSIVISGFASGDTNPYGAAQNGFTKGTTADPDVTLYKTVTTASTETPAISSTATNTRVRFAGFAFAEAITYTYARPTSDITTQWSTSSGSTHYTLIDETVADDNDYIVATAAGQTDEVKLASMTPPQVGTNLVINYKVTAVDGGATVTASLRQGSGGTLIKADTTRNANGTYALAVAPGDWALVTDWSDLRLRFVSA